MGLHTSVFIIIKDICGNNLFQPQVRYENFYYFMQFKHTNTKFIKVKSSLQVKLFTSVLPVVGICHEDRQ